MSFLAVQTARVWQRAVPAEVPIPSTLSRLLWLWGRRDQVLDFLIHIRRRYPGLPGCSRRQRSHWASPLHNHRSRGCRRVFTFNLIQQNTSEIGIRCPWVNWAPLCPMWHPHLSVCCLCTGPSERKGTGVTGDSLSSLTSPEDGAGDLIRVAVKFR